MKRLVMTGGLAAIVLAAALARADVRLHALFGDDMVLQQNANPVVWGTADPGEEVTVSIADQKAAATADPQGCWTVTLKPMKAGGPLEMAVSGKNKVTLKNVMVGEVWVCSGQSNMTFSVGGSRNAADEIKAADFPNIRLFTVPQRAAAEPQKDVAGRWAACSPKTVGGFSAVAYFFGRELHKKLNVPVALIHTSWGGTAAELWVSAEAFAAEPALKAGLTQRDIYLKSFEAARAAYPQKLADWERAAEAAKKEGKQPPAKPPAPTLGHFPTCLYSAMIAPLVRYPIAGVIWYQGEANASSWPRAAAYDVLFPALIKDWRAKWGRDFPFLFVQLANYKPRQPEPAESAWARLRESQAKALALPNTGMAVIIDVGEANDIHPKNKQDVGLRLALAARAVAYGEKDLAHSGPVYESMKVDGEKVTVKFKHVGGGLVARNMSAPAGAGDTMRSVEGFALAGEDRKFVWADAKILDDTVVVSSANVPKPVAVRYVWADNPACNLCNKDGLPACPFRTDDWTPGAR